MSSKSSSVDRALSPREIRRYGRHLVLPEVGPQGQETLKRASVAVVGAGGLGSPAALYLAAAGVGTLGIVDFDVVESSNLQRQILYGESDLGRVKVDVAQRRLEDINPLITVEAHGERLDATNARRVLSAYDLVLDGSDNFATRYLVNDACVLLRKPNVYGSIFRFEGQVAVFASADGPCYRCLFPEPPPPGTVPSCTEGGVLGVLPGIVGALQASEALKLILGIGRPLVGRLLLVDALGAEFREVSLPRDPECPVCGDNPSIQALSDVRVSCGEERTTLDVGPAEVSGWLARDEQVTLLDVRTPIEVSICRLPGSIVVPLSELPRRVGELDQQRPCVVYCHHGRRSALAAALLRERGFERVFNLAGGIEAWAREVDPSMARY